MVCLRQANFAGSLPTLVRKLPEPIMKMICDLSNAERVLVGLDVRPMKPDSLAANG